MSSTACVVRLAAYGSNRNARNLGLRFGMNDGFWNVCNFASATMINYEKLGISALLFPKRESKHKAD